MLKVFADHNESTSPRPTALQKALGTQYGDVAVEWRINPRSKMFGVWRAI